jgi:DnaJ-domain-containing protein 1
MELAAVIFMLVAGGIIALGVMLAASIARRESDRNTAARPQTFPERDRIAASILFHVVTLGGVSRDVALREVRRGTGIAAPVTAGIDIASWGESFARAATQQQREWLLETAVQLVASRGALVPLLQYVALLDLSFALGFQTNALAKLREQYAFDYVDHAKDGRPREADRAGRVTFFQRDESDLLRILGIDGNVSRQSIISAYRKLAAQHHPDRFHSASETERNDAAARFIEITRAYEALLALYRE